MSAGATVNLTDVFFTSTVAQINPLYQVSATQTILGLSFVFL